MNEAEDKEFLEILPRGRNAVDPEVVRHSQRSRIVRATTEAVAELSYPRTTIAEIVKRAGVAKPTFYEHFEDKEDCFLKIYDESVAGAFNSIAEEIDHPDPVETRVRQGLHGFLAYLSADDARARLIMLEAENAGKAAIARHVSTHRAYAVFYISLREQAREHDSSLSPISMTRAESIVGAVNEPICSTLRRGDAGRLTALEDDLVAAVRALALASR